MKKVLFFAFIFVAPLASVKAEPVELDLKYIKLVLPLQNLDVEYLYDVRFEKNMAGLSTPFLTDKSRKKRLVAGIASEEGKPKATFYFGGDAQVSEKYFSETFNIGGWIGADTTIHGNIKDKLRGGVKASVKVW